MKAIIIEDELNVRQGFVKMLNSFCPEVDIIAEANKVEDGIMLVNKIDFDILFLDIQLPDGSGFDLMHRIDNFDFNLIFVTAFDKYAVQAFELSAIDYLLKPVSPNLLKNAISKAKLMQTTAFKNESIKIARTQIEQKYQQENKIILKDQDSLHIVKVEELIYCKAEGSYTKFVLKDGGTILTSTNLKEYEKLLHGYKFYRNHHSYLVNLHHIVELKKQEGGSLVLSNKTEIPISVRKKVGIVEDLKRLYIS